MPAMPAVPAVGTVPPVPPPFVGIVPPVPPVLLPPVPLLLPPLPSPTAFPGVADPALHPTTAPRTTLAKIPAKSQAENRVLLAILRTLVGSVHSRSARQP